MKSPVIKRSIVIAGHKTSVSIEDAFWTALKEIAQLRRQSLAELIGAIDGARRGGNLSSAIRVFVLDYDRGRYSECDSIGRHPQASTPKDADGRNKSGHDGLWVFPNSQPENLARIHDVQRIERAFDRTHDIERRLAVLGRHILHFALADAVLAGAGAVHRQRAVD